MLCNDHKFIALLPEGKMDPKSWGYPQIIPNHPLIHRIFIGFSMKSTIQRFLGVPPFGPGQEDRVKCSESAQVRAVAMLLILFFDFFCFFHFFLIFPFSFIWSNFLLLFVFHFFSFSLISRWLLDPLSSTLSHFVQHVPWMSVTAGPGFSWTRLGGRRSSAMRHTVLVDRTP